VGYIYRIGKFEVTAGQYCGFLNAVARTDTYGLYSFSMPGSCGIYRSGTPGSHTYSISDANQVNRPVNYVTFWDTCRFANWLHNGRPTGGEAAGTTETGAYTLNGYNGGDGTHPSRSGRDKVARLLLGLCKNDPNAKRWFRGPGAAARQVSVGIVARATEGVPVGAVPLVPPGKAAWRR